MKLSCRGLAGHLLATVAAAAALLSGAPGYAAKLQYKLAAPPAWVIPIAPAYASRQPHSAVGGVEALLKEMQTRIEANGKTTFRHVAVKALASSGVEAAGNMSMDFEPSDQSSRCTRST